MDNNNSYDCEVVDKYSIEELPDSIDPCSPPFQFLYASETLEVTKDGIVIDVVKIFSKEEGKQNERQNNGNN